MNRNIFRINFKMGVSIGFIVFEGLLSGCTFLVLMQILNLAFEGNVGMPDIFKTTAAVAVIFMARLVIYSLAYTGSQIGGADVSRRIRMAIGDKLRRIPLGSFTKNRTGFYINASTTEVSDYEQILTHKLADIVKYVILLLAIALYCMTIYLPTGIMLLLACLAIIPAMYASVLQVQRYGKMKNLSREENVSAITEYIQGSQVFRAYGLAGTKNASLTRAMKAYSDISYQYEKSVIPIGNAFGLLSYVVLAVTIYLTTSAWTGGTLLPGEVILMIMLSLFAAKVNLSLYISLVAYKNLSISKGKIQSIFKEKEDRQEGIFKPEDCNIQFSDVTFSYQDQEQVLDHMCFEVPEGKLTAIVGDSGSGKSTIFNLICRYYLPQHGKITIGGEDISQATAEQVLDQISLVDQDTFFFNDTIMANIRYAREEATDEEIREACKAANCEGFILGLEQGYDTMMGENGCKLSGGERQRLSIARAMIRNRPIILLDEATASLDIENELAVKQAISHLLTDHKTVIMIAHTLSIVRQADQILVLEDGRITQQGTHEELMKNKGKYYRMWSAI